MATEAHLFAAAHAAAGGDNAAVWVVKRATGTHSADAAVTAHASCVLRHALAPPGVDRVAQRYVTRPALLRGRKFDVRVYVAVRAFAPALVAAVDGRYYGRLAAAPFALDAASLTRFDTHFTVGWYAAEAKAGAAGAAPAEAASDDGALPALLSRRQLEAAAAAEGYDWSAADAAMRACLRELFTAAGRTVGAFPAGRALYGCDVLFERDDAGALQPRLLEVNFCGDLATLLSRVPGGAPGFVDDVMGYLFGADATPAAELQPLA